LYSANSSSPDVVIIDALRSIDNARLELESQRLLFRDKAKYLLIGNRIDYKDFILMVRGGMDGFLRLHDLSPQTLARTIDAVQSGEYAIPRTMIASLVVFVRSTPEMAYEPVAFVNDEDTLDSGLSVREKEVLRLLAMGARNREIADLLMISIATVNKHVQNIFTKLQVHSRTAAMRKVLFAGGESPQ
jgi:DNA-binding NarL/FixJ family response regulator